MMYSIMIVCLLLAACCIWHTKGIDNLTKDYRRLQRQLETLEEKLASAEEETIGTKTAIGVKLAELEARVGKLDDYGENVKEFDDRLMTGLQEIMNYDIHAASGGGK